MKIKDLKCVGSTVLIITESEVYAVEIDLKSTNILSTRFDPRTVYPIKVSTDVLVYLYDGDTYLYD